ncbi:hypothetical protein P4V64_18205 [Bacillus thuringiensis]|nr:hypothetical protein [Bacillus thuringiensis]
MGTRNGVIYGNEMTDDDHSDLLKALNDHRGPVLLSGYANELYEDLLSEWQRKERQSSGAADNLLAARHIADGYKMFREESESLQSRN